MKQFTDQIKEKQARASLYRNAHIKAILSRVQHASMNVLLDANICKYLSDDSISEIKRIMINDLTTTMNVEEENMVTIETRADLLRVYNSVLSTLKLKPVKEDSINIDLEFLIQAGEVVSIHNKENDTIIHYVFTKGYSDEAIGIITDMTGKMIISRWIDNDGRLYSDGGFIDVVIHIAKGNDFKINDLAQLGITVTGESLSHKTRTMLTFTSSKYSTTVMYGATNG